MYGDIFLLTLRFLSSHRVTDCDWLGGGKGKRMITSSSRSSECLFLFFVAGKKIGNFFKRPSSHGTRTDFVQRPAAALKRLETDTLDPTPKRNLVKERRIPPWRILWVGKRDDITQPKVDIKLLPPPTTTRRTTHTVLGPDGFAAGKKGNEVEEKRVGIFIFIFICLLPLPLQIHSPNLLQLSLFLLSIFHLGTRSYINQQGEFSQGSGPKKQGLGDFWSPLEQGGNKSSQGKHEQTKFYDPRRRFTE